MHAQAQVLVRLARRSDAEALVAVYRALGYPSTVDQIQARLDRVADDPGYRTWVAAVEGLVVGMAGAIRRWSYEHDPPHVQLLALAVVDEAQGRGAGRALIEAVEAWARDQGAGRVVVNSGSHRTAAHAFYRARGYAETGVRFVKRTDA